MAQHRFPCGSPVAALHPCRRAIYNCKICCKIAPLTAPSPVRPFSCRLSQATGKAKRASHRTAEETETSLALPLCPCNPPPPPTHYLCSVCCLPAFPLASVESEQAPIGSSCCSDAMVGC